MGNVLANTGKISAINRMLALGLFETKFKELTPEILSSPVNEVACYRITPFGNAVLSRVREKNNFNNVISEYLTSDEGKKALAKN